jgi:hypothetical protein
MVGQNASDLFGQIPSEIADRLHRVPTRLVVNPSLRNQHGLSGHFRSDLVGN